MLKAYTVELPNIEGFNAFLILDDGEEQQVIRGGVEVIELMANELPCNVVRWRYFEHMPYGKNRKRIDTAEYDGEVLRFEDAPFERGQASIDMLNKYATGPIFGKGASAS